MAPETWTEGPGLTAINDFQGFERGRPLSFFRWLLRQIRPGAAGRRGGENRRDRRDGREHRPGRKRPSAGEKPPLATATYPIVEPGNPPDPPAWGRQRASLFMINRGGPRG